MASDADSLQDDFPNHQVHYILAGTASDAGPETNIRNVQLGEEPWLNQRVRLAVTKAQLSAHRY